MSTDPMWCFENYGEAAQYIDELEQQRDELAAALETVCEGWTLPAGVRKVLETALAKVKP